MEIWFKDKDGNECLFLSEELMTSYVAERVADNIKAEGWATIVWTVEL